jgi:hypothetical protein
MPAALPDVLALQPVVVSGSTDPAADPFALPVDLEALPGVVLHESADATWHGLCRQGRAAHQFWLAERPPGGACGYAVLLLLDKLYELRAEAAMRFWRMLSGRPPASPKYDFSERSRQRHALMLRALDARLGGASYREIGETVLGFTGDKDDWLKNPRKNQARRLVADARLLMRGGYRRLLRHPFQPKSRR